MSVLPTVDWIGYSSANLIITPIIAAINDPKTPPSVLKALSGKGLSLGFLDALGITESTDLTLASNTPIFPRLTVYSGTLTAPVVSFGGGPPSLTSVSEFTFQWGWHYGTYIQDIWTIPTTVDADPQNYVTKSNQSIYNKFYFDSVVAIANDTDPKGTLTRNIGLTRNDADTLFLLQTGQIKRNQVKGISPLLDKILYNPGFPTRTIATSSPDANSIATGPGGTNPTATVTASSIPDEPSEPTLTQALKVPVTAAMLVGLQGIESQLTTRELIASPLMTSLNSGNYKEALGMINMVTDTKGKKVSNPEKLIADMQKEGLPSEDCSVTETLYRTDARPYINPTQTQGFSDPNGKYPSVINEPGTNRLSRNESVTRTILTKKESSRVTDVRTANKVEWSQPKQPYNAKYPYNKVRQTESGHIEEYDDTPGFERTHWYNKSGTYEEIDRNGSKVQRIVGDNFEILERNGNVIIKGMCNVTIMGDSNIRVEQNAYVDIKGNAETKVLGDMKSYVDGTVYLDSESTINIIGKGALNVSSLASINLQAAQDINLAAGRNINTLTMGNVTVVANGTLTETAIGNVVIGSNGSVSVNSMGNVGLNSNGNVSINSAKLDLNPGSAASNKSASRNQLNTPIIRKPQSYNRRPNPRFSELTSVTRNAENVAQYETPTDGSPTSYNETVKSSGIDAPTTAESKMIAKDSKSGGAGTAPPIVPDKSLTTGVTVFTPNFPLSPNFTLFQLYNSPCGGPTNDPVVIDNLRALCLNCLEPIYKRYPNVKLTSGYRTKIPKGGVALSDHLIGCAADFVLTGFTRKEMRDAVVDISNLMSAYTQLILEYTDSSCWIHVSYNRDKGAKQQKFTMLNSKTVPSGQFVLVA